MLKKSNALIISLIVLFVLLPSNKIFAYNYTTINAEKIFNKYIWTGFKYFHNGFVHPPHAYKGENIEYSFIYQYIAPEETTVRTGVSSGSNRAIGYGSYAMDYQKHILGLLFYIAHNINTNDYETAFTKQPTPHDEPVPVQMAEACNIVAGAISLNNYSKKYRDNIFKDFWHKCFKSEYSDILLKLENEFYYKAYGHSAVTYVNDYFIDIDSLSEKAPAIRGAIFSLTEARYRNKNLGNKYNLQLICEAGDVLPFLIYFNCDYTDLSNGQRTYSNIKFEKKIRKLQNRLLEKIDYIELPKEQVDIDQVIDGAYQYMVYYYGKEGNSEKQSTVTSNFGNESDDDDIDLDYKGEYEELTGRPFPTLQGKELEAFYDKIEEKKAIFKKSKSNSYGTFGEDEEYNIESDINYSVAIANMKAAMENTIGLSAFTSMQGETNIARTYLMAKNIMDSSRVRDEFSYYDIGTNVIMKTPGADGDIYLLSDFQKVKLDAPLYDIDDEGVVETNEDTDKDGIIDRNEMLMPISIDITEFVRKTLYADLYGKDPVNISAQDKRDRDNSIDIRLSQYKQRVKSNFATARSNNEYEYEFQYDSESDKLLVSAWMYRSNPVLKDTDFDGIEDGIGEEKVKEHAAQRGIAVKDVPYSVAKKDLRPLDNNFKGIMNSNRLGGDKGIEVDMTMDYRYFLMDNKLYYDELSTMSLLYANSIYRKGPSMHSGLALEDIQNLSTSNEEDQMQIGSAKYKNLRAKDMMEFFGFNKVKTYYMGERGDGTEKDPADGADVCRGYKDTHKGMVALGYKNIEYHGIEKTVVGVVIRGTAEDDDWDSDFDMGDLDLRNDIQQKTKAKTGHENYIINPGEAAAVNVTEIDKYLNSSNNKKYDHKYNTELSHFAYGYPDWTHQYHHAGFDIISNRILEVIQEYYNENYAKFNSDICFWITGHSMGGGVPNLLASKLIDGYGNLGGNRDNVYCYTFAAPNTFYKTDNVNYRYSAYNRSEIIEERYREPKASKYRCIFNIVNDDDFVPQLPMEKCEWTKYGKVAKVSCIELKSNIIIPKKSYQNYLRNIYKCNKNDVDAMIESFNNVYKDYQLTDNNMRKDTYAHYEVSNSFNKEDVLNNNKNARPYQKIENNKQKQFPAYFLQSIAHSVHTLNDNPDNDGIVRDVSNDYIFGNKHKKLLYFISVAKRYATAKSKLIHARDSIELPHYIESYYSLTKEISTNIFK